MSNPQAGLREICRFFCQKPDPLGQLSGNKAHIAPLLSRGTGGGGCNWLVLIAYSVLVSIIYRYKCNMVFYFSSDFTLADHCIIFVFSLNESPSRNVLTRVTCYKSVEKNWKILVVMNFCKIIVKFSTRNFTNQIPPRIAVVVMNNASLLLGSVCQ